MKGSPNFGEPFLSTARPCKVVVDNRNDGSRPLKSGTTNLQTQVKRDVCFFWMKSLHSQITEIEGESAFLDGGSQASATDTSGKATPRAINV